jgi:acetyl-CoA/propionyl-CoA carboxylase biotin carboxyl carrier protein
MLQGHRARPRPRRRPLPARPRAGRTVVLGVGTNTAFLRALLADPEVRAGRLDTGLVERELDALTTSAVPVEAYAAFALSRLAALRPAGPAPDPWDVPSGWRTGGRHAPLHWDLAGPGGERLTVSLTGGTRLRSATATSTRSPPTPSRAGCCSPSTAAR